MLHYTYRIIIEPDTGGAFHAWVPSLPGCHTWGESLESARANVKDAITVYLSAAAEDNGALPQDRGFEYFETVTDSEVKQASNA